MGATVVWLALAVAAGAADLLAAVPPPFPQLVLLTLVAVLLGLFGGSARLAPGALTGPSPFRRYEMRHSAATGTLGEGENLEVDPPRRLVQGFRALWSEDMKAEGTSTVTWEIEPVGDSCRLTVTHRDLREGANAELYGGWPMILSGLKTWLETGERLTTPGSLRYS